MWKMMALNIYFRMAEFSHISPQALGVSPAEMPVNYPDDS